METVKDCNAPELDEPLAVLSRDRARDEDAHWERAHSREYYYKRGLDYEDYAPAYCVGYIGRAQYGGRFEDAERSLCANWERIKGDSTLSLEDALLAMRAAWDRMAAHAHAQAQAQRKRQSARPYAPRSRLPTAPAGEAARQSSCIWLRPA